MKELREERIRVLAILWNQCARAGALSPLEADNLVWEKLHRWFTVLLDRNRVPPISEYEYIYHRALMSAFLDRPLQEGDMLDNYPLFTPLMETLIYMDFNHPAMLEQVTGAWMRSLKRMGWPEDRIKRIRYWQTLFAVLPRQKTYSLYPGRISLRDLLEDWLCYQLEFPMF